MVRVKNDFEAKEEIAVLAFCFDNGQQLFFHHRVILLSGGKFTGVECDGKVILHDVTSELQ
eukprot:5770785-Ditylum_brightwellii.AAC.1